MKRFALKRITALVLALIMTLSLLPMNVWAETTEYTPLFWSNDGGVTYNNGIDVPIEQKTNNGGYRVNLYVKNGDSYSAIDEGTFGNGTIQKLSNDIGFFGWSDNIGVFWNTENTVAGTESGVVFTVGEVQYRVNLKVIAVSLDEEATEFIAQYAKDADGNIIDISDPSSVSWDNNKRIEQGLWYWRKMSTEQKAAVNAQLGDVTFDDMLAVAVQKIFPTATEFISLFLATGEMYFTAITAENLWTLKNAASYFNYLSNEVKAEVDGAVNTNFAPIRTESTTLSFADIAAASDFIHNFVSVGGDEKTLITKLDNTSTGDDVWPISRGESVWGTLTAVQKTAVNKSLANADSNAQTYEQMLEYAKTQTGGSGDGNGNSGGESALLGVPFDTTAVKELSFDETVAILKNETGEFNFTNSNPNLDTLQEIWAFSRSIDTYWRFDETFKKLETDYSYTVAQGFNDVVQAGWYIGGYLSTLDPAVYTWEAKLDKLDSNLTDYDTFVYAYELVDSYFASHMTLTKEQRDLVDTYIETDLDDGYAKATAAIKAQSDETVVEQFKIKFLQDNLTNEMITADNVMLIRNHPDGGGALNPWNVMGGEGIFRDILSKTQQDAVDTLCGGEGCYYELLRLAQAYWIAHLDKNISAENALAIVKSTEIGSALITLINNALLYGRPVQLAISAEVTEAMDATDKAALDNAVPSGYEVENYQDLGVTVTVDGQTTDVTQTNGKVTVKVGKAENGKEYKMVRKHGDKVDVLPVTVDSNGDIYVESDQFSSYALVSTSSNNGPFSNLSDAAKVFVDEYIDYNLFPNGDGYYVQVFPKGAVVCWDSDDVNDCYYINEASKTAARAVFAAYDALSSEVKAEVSAAKIEDLSETAATISFALEIYRGALERNAKDFFGSIAEVKAANAEAGAWLEEYISYEAKIGDAWFTGVSASEHTLYAKNEASYNLIKAACNAYAALSDDAKAAIEKLFVNWPVDAMVNEYGRRVQQDYYGLLDNVTDPDAIAFIENYVFWGSVETNYFTEFAGEWQWDEENEVNVYNPSAVVDALDAYAELSDEARTVLNALTVKMGDPNYADEYWVPTFGEWIEWKQSNFTRVDSIEAIKDISEDAYNWLNTYMVYDPDSREVWFDGASMKEGYPVDEDSYDLVKAACDAYIKLSNDAKAAVARLAVDWPVAEMISECCRIVQLPYYTLLAGVTDEDAIEFIEAYVTCRAYEDWYMTMLTGAWQYDESLDREVYNPTAAKAALDAYNALSDTSKKALESQVVKQGNPYNPNDYWTPTFAEWMQRQQADYLFQTNPDAGTLLDPKEMTDVSAKDFFEDYFEYEVYTDNYFGCDVLNFWMNVPTAPDGGYLTQEGYDKAERMLNAYNALSETSKKELDKLLVDGSGNDSFSWRLLQRYGSLRMAAPTGTAATSSLSQDAWDLLEEIGLTLTADGELSITGVKMVYVDGEYQYWIDYSKTNSADGLANMNKVVPVLENWFGFNFNNNLPYPPMNQRNWNICNELNQLKITVNGEEMWFDKAMEYFLQIWERMQHNGYYTDYIFQTVGYTSLPLGTSETKVTDPGFENGFFYVDVADGLILGEDYAYEYTYKGTTYIYDDAKAAVPKTVENVDPSLEGVLTVYAYAGKKEHWGEAAGNTHKVMANAGVLFHVSFVGPANADRHAGVCGNGFDGVFTKYLRHNEEVYAQQLYDSCYMGTNSGNGRPMASINQVGDVVTVTANDHYGSDHQLVAWFHDEVIVGLNMLRYRVIADDFSYEFNKPVEKTEATAVTFNNATKWETVKNVLGELIVRPTNGTIKETLASETNTPYNAFGCFTLMPPETDYTLDTNASNALTQDGMVWVKSVDSATNAVTLNLYAADYDGGRDSAVFYTFVWKNSAGDIIEEELTVRVKERQSFFAEMKKGDIVAQPMSKTDATVTPPVGVTTTYDEATGYLEVDFDESNLPSLDVVKELYNRAGVRMTPPEDAMYFRFTMGDGNEDLAYIHTSRANELVVGLEEAKIKPLYRSSGSMSPDAQYELVFPYAAIDPMVLGELTIYFAYTQNYRWQVVEWLDVDKNTIGYTYVYGKNGSLVQTETTASVSDEKDLPVDENGQLEQPIIVGEGMNLVANRYIQEGGGGKHWYLRLSVDEESNLDKVNGNWVYLPYDYVGMTWEQAQVLKHAGQTPVIYHYEQGENMPPTKIEGEYAPQGIKFNVKSFSPFVVEVSGMDAPEYTAPANLTAIYGQTLADIELPTADNGTWSWKVADTTSVGDVGEHLLTLVFTPNDTENYVTVEETVTITVSAAIPSVTLPEAKNSVIYGNKLSDVGLTDGWTWASGDTIPTVQNTGYVACFTPTDTGNYDWSKIEGWNAEKGIVERTVAVTVAKQKVAKPASDTKEFVYDGTEQTYSLVDTNLYTISNNKRTVAGEQMVLVKLDDTANFEWEDGTVAELQYTFTIAKASLTITANPNSITYGAAPANAGVSYEGFVNSETASVLTGTLSYSYDYMQYGDVGTYAITPAGLSSANYEITFVNGVLTVEKKEIGIEWGSTDLTYSGEAQKPTATATGAVNGDVLTLTVSGEQTNASAEAYTATVTAITGEKAENYSLPSVATAEFTIAKATQAAPVVVGVNETVFAKNDGKITDVTNAMEYSVDGSTYTAITDGKLENLAPATYYVRYAETENRLASDVVTVVIAAGKKVTVTFAVNGGNAIEAIKDLAYGDKVTAPTEPKKAGYTFAGWFSDEACTKAWDFDKATVSADVTLYAKWNAIPAVYPPYVPETPTTTPEPPVETKPTTPTQPVVPPAEVTVPVSGEENTINVEASVSGSTAAIDKVDMTKLEGVIGDDVAVGTVTIDFSVLESAEVIDEVEIPSEVVKEIAEAVADPNNDAESLEIVLSDGASIEFDAAALAEKAAQAGGTDITISIKQAVENVLSAAQQAAVGDCVAFDINVTSGGVHISDMGGKITIHAPYELRDGETAEGIVVYYVDDEGNREKCETSYDSVKKRVNWKTDHLSVYMIAHEAPATDDAPAVDNTPADDAAQSDSGNSVGLWIGVALAVLVVAIIVVMILIKRKKA